MEQQFYIERLSDERFDFKLWEKAGSTYYNVATLHYNDPVVGTQWNIVTKTAASKYRADEIEDELENPLRWIAPEKAKHLLRLSSAREANDFVKKLFSNL